MAPASFSSCTFNHWFPGSVFSRHFRLLIFSLWNTTFLYNLRLSCILFAWTSRNWILWSRQQSQKMGLGRRVNKRPRDSGHSSREPGNHMSEGASRSGNKKTFRWRVSPERNLGTGLEVEFIGTERSFPSPLACQIEKAEALEWWEDKEWSEGCREQEKLW